MNDNAPLIPKETKPPYRISIRMSAEERKLIGRKATLAHLSISRFLVETAVHDGAISPHDKMRLRWLLTLFEKTAERLASLSECPTIVRAEPAVRQELTAALHLIEALTEEMRKRIG
jgi:uncharacterized protein (DUF1778 family)